MKLYGNLTNRFEEGKNYNSDKLIHTGDDITMYYYSDRKCYYVTKVNNQKDIEVAQYRVKHVGEPMSNEWEYIKEDNAVAENWVYRYNKWQEKVVWSLNDFNNVRARLDGDLKADCKEEDKINYALYMAHLTDSDYEKLLAGKKVVKYHDLSGKVSFGVRDYYYDYEF